MVVRSLLMLLALYCSTGMVLAQQDVFRGLDQPASLFDSSPDEPQTAKVDSQIVQIDAHTVELQVTVTPPSGFYIYSTTTRHGQKTKIIVEQTAGLTPTEQDFTADHPPKKEFNEDFQGDVEKYTEAVVWSQQLKSDKPLSGTVAISGKVRGQICSTGIGGVCIPLYPAPKFTAQLDVAEVAASLELPTSSAETLPASSTDSEHPSTFAASQQGTDADTARIRYTVSLTPASSQPGDEVQLIVRADIAEGWHTYSTSPVADDMFGGTPTEITLTSTSGLKSLDDEFQASVEPTIHRGPLDDEMEIHEGTVEWRRRFQVTDANASASGTVSGQVCTETTCEPPGKVEFAVALGAPVDGESLTFGSIASDSQSTDSGSGSSHESIQTASDSAGEQQSLLWLILSGAGAGFVALLTPCVFPMIPVTVAFFLKQGESGKGNAKVLALVYCLGIIGTFTFIGVLVSAIAGPLGMTQLANNAWLNLVFAVVFVAFALMLMGVFELRVPTSVLNWSAQREGQGGLLGVLFMALTFTLVSFTCTTAFVAGVLAVAAQGDSYLRPILGMLAFSTAFALPFFFLALFPGFLAQLPKSGGWMQKVKSTAGLIELAFVIKFLSVADIGFSPDATPRFVDYTTAMVLWATLAFVTGLYLLGVFRFSKDTPTDGISPVGGIFGIGSIGFALLVCVGLFSPREPDNWIWDRLVGFAPPQIEVAVAGGGLQHAGIRDEFSELAGAKYALSHDGLVYALQLEDALDIARKHNRPVFVDFTGVYCINCRDMEKSVLNQPEILSILSTVPRAQLFLDEIPSVQDGTEEERLLSTNLELSIQFTGGAAMPSYLLLAPDGETVMSSTSGLVSEETFRSFLKSGLQRFEETQSDVEVSQTTQPTH